jgi:hypothetical protein
LFLDWQVVSDAEWQVKLQFGRNKNYHWLYSATRDVPHTRPSIVLPQSMYVDTFRDFALGVDGIVLVVNKQNTWGDWDLNFSYGTSPISNKQKENLLGEQANGNLNHDKDAQVSLFWRPKFSQWQLGISGLNVDFSYEPELSDIYFHADNKTKRFNLHFLYQSQNWEIAGELMRERTIAKGFFHPLFSRNTTAEGGYVQGRFFLNTYLTLITRLDVYERDRKDRNGEKLALSSGSTIANYFGYMDQATLGLTWKLKKNLQLQAEYHKTKGTGHLAPYLMPDIQNNDHKYCDMWALQLMYWF